MDAYLFGENQIPRQLCAWVVRAGDNNELAEAVIEKSAVAIGWDAVGDLSRVDKMGIRRLYTREYPDHSRGRTAQNVGQLQRFVHELKVGDYVLTFNSQKREFSIGCIDGAYLYSPELFHGYSGSYPHVRRVTWKKCISRDQIDDASRNTLGSIMTVFNINSLIPQIEYWLGHTAGGPVIVDITPEEGLNEEAPPFFDQTVAYAKERIADRIDRIDPYDFQDLVAALLKAMGFRVQSAPKGRDGGIDIVAFPDALGFGKPRIVAQVKHRIKPTDRPTLDAFLGVMKPYDNGLFVSTCGFTAEAKTRAIHASANITLVDREQFIELLTEYYAQLDSKFQAIIPLKQVWLPLDTE